MKTKFCYRSTAADIRRGMRSVLSLHSSYVDSGYDDYVERFFIQAIHDLRVDVDAYPKPISEALRDDFIRFWDKLGLHGNPLPRLSPAANAMAELMAAYHCK